MKLVQIFELIFFCFFFDICYTVYIYNSYGWCFCNIMKRNELLVGIFIIFVIFFCFNIISNVTFAYHYDSDYYTLFYKDNMQELKDDMKKYLDDYGGLFIVNTDYSYSDVLTKNYNYLVYFACDYILKNRDRYIDDIVHMDSFSYYSNRYVRKSTDEYVPIELVYTITDKFFGIRDFKIINDDVKIIDDYVSLIEYADDTFLNKLIDVDIREKDDNVLVYAKYDYGNYLFTFFKKYHVLKLYNIEVLS